MAATVEPVLAVDVADPVVRQRIARKARRLRGLRMLYLEATAPLDPVLEDIRQQTHDVTYEMWPSHDGRYRALVYPAAHPWTTSAYWQGITRDLYRGLKDALEALYHHDPERARELAARLYLAMDAAPSLQRRFDGLLHHLTGARHSAGDPPASS